MAVKSGKGRRKSKLGAYGQVGPRTYHQVLQLVEKEGLSVAKACERVARETGREVGTVTNTYYRLARLKPGTAKLSTASASVSPKRKPGRPPKVQGAEALLNRIASDLQQLRALLAQQAKASEQMKRDAALAVRLREALGA